MGGPGWDRQPMPVVTEKSEVISDTLLAYRLAEPVDLILKVHEDILSRKAHGTEKYKVPLMSHNGRDALMDAYEEIHDFAVYMQQFQMETEHTGEKVALRELVKDALVLVCRTKAILLRREKNGPNRKET